MKTLYFSMKDFERDLISAANINKLNIQFTGDALSAGTVMQAKGFDAVSIFAGDDASAPVIEQLQKLSVKYIAIRSAGYDNTDIVMAKKLGIKVANVPEYSPYAIAEHSVALMLALNRKIVCADKQVHLHNFKMNNLIGFDMHKKTVGIIGTGRTGRVAVKILHGFGCKILANDIQPDAELEQKYGLTYTSLETVCSSSDIISLYIPLDEKTRHLVDDRLIKKMKRSVMLINIARGAVVNTADVIANLRTGQIGFYGADVYEKEKGVFFYDHSPGKIQDEMLLQLLDMPNVLITPHQAFATNEALQNIADSTLYNLNCWFNNKKPVNELTG